MASLMHTHLVQQWPSKFCCDPFVPLALSGHFRSELRLLNPETLEHTHQGIVRNGKQFKTQEVPPPLPYLSEYAEEDWFEGESEKKAYIDRLSQMKILPPRYVGEGAIPEDKYPEFWWLIHVHGLCPFLLQREGYFPRFIAAAFTSVSVDDNLNDEGQGTFYFVVSLIR
ncbi:hypothetical protein PIB30_014845 [Stylosanthes scabra]|uniref:Uncharacterized protein n=1 Tax=Stylosanthes scabra TaxID=79078 RepID=A0ABU6S7D0_9FABA|nr:hypothetical protein [Stylosanthes scabra]